MTYEDGRMYKGQYEQEIQQGYGIHTWPDGRKYEGYWVNGRQHGEGSFTNVKGEINRGFWENGDRIRWADSDKISSPKQQK